MAALVCSATTAACSDADDSTTPTTTTTPAPTTTIEPDDGVLRLGVLLPLSGPGAELGRSMSDAVTLAVDQVNAAGGFGGNAVVMTLKDEGDGPISASHALEQLLAADVDAVIGPGSSLVALDLLVTLRRERLLTCSPSATALALDDFPDDGLFFRTVPSDSVQAGALARAIDRVGEPSVAVLYLDDSYGRPLTDSLTTELEERAVDVVKLVPLRPDDPDYADEAHQAIESGAPVIAVVADATAGQRVVAALLDEPGDSATPIYVNDALRGSTLGNLISERDGTGSDRLRGVGLHLLSDSMEFSEAFEARFPDASGFLAVNAVECVDLIVLSAHAAASTRSEVVARQVIGVAAGGQPCFTFAVCQEALADGRNIDYQGPSGVLELSSAGESTRGIYDLFGYDDLGRERSMGTVTVGADVAAPTL